MYDELIGADCEVCANQAMAKAYIGISPTVAKSLAEQIQHDEDRLAKRKELLALLEKNPDLERAMTLMREVGRL